MKVIFIGCVISSNQMLEKLITIDCAEVVGIVTREASAFNADFFSLYPLAKKNNIPCYFSDKKNAVDLPEWIKSLKPDVIYCFGWSYLLKRNILDIPPLGVIGHHPTILPKNRGRHPVIWALALGLKQTGSTFFFMDEGADSGDILSQEILAITEDDDAETLDNKITEVALKQQAKFTIELANGTYDRIPQDHNKASYWRKRSKKDGEIDWRMSAKSIYNLVRALTRPYVGAHFCFNNSEHKVWKTLMVKLDSSYDNVEPGKVLEISDKGILIKCGEHAVRLLEYDCIEKINQGIYLI